MPIENISEVVLFGLVLLLMILGIVQKAKASKAAKTWQNTSGTVKRSELSISHDTDSDGTSSTTYAANVVYNYQVNELSYKNDALSFGKVSAGRRKAEKKLAQYPVGSRLTVYYDPKDPAKAVLEPVAASFGTYLVIGIILIISGIVSSFLLK